MVTQEERRGKNLKSRAFSGSDSDSELTAASGASQRDGGARAAAAAAGLTRSKALNVKLEVQDSGNLTQIWAR